MNKEFIKTMVGKKCGRQGDLRFERVDSLPENVVKVERGENGNFILAHSETGHHHVMPERDVEFFNVAANDGTIDEFTSYLKVNRPTALTHLRSFDTHTPIKFDEGLYRLKRQREYTLEGFRKAQD